MNEKLDINCFQIISHAGTARSAYIMAVDAAEKGDYDEANRLIEEGEKEFVICQKSHSEVIHMEESGKLREPNLLLLHSEDQMMSAETFKIMAERMVNMYKRIGELEGK